MVSNLWPIALRTTAPVAVEDHITAQIQERFLQPPDLFHNDIARIAQMRIDATRTTVPESTLADQILVYYRHLCTLTSKFHDDLWEATWMDQVHGSTKRQSLAFERCNVLYNLAATYAMMGLAEDRRTMEGLKQSHAKLQQSAGLFAMLVEDCRRALDEVQLPHELSEEAITSLEQLTLAEAQECIWQRAVMDRMKDKLIAQLSQQVSVYYAAALSHHQKSNALDSKLVHHLSLKRAHFAAAAQFRMSSHAVSQQAYGEEVARLQLARELCNGASSHRDYVAAPIANDFTSLVERVASSLERAERDNDIIYMIPVPTPSQLADIVPTSMVKPVLSETLKASLSSTTDTLFVSLMSSVVSNVLAIYNHRKDQLVASRAIQPMSKLTSEMTEFLQTHALPGALTALEQPLGLPDSILRATEQIKAKGGLPHLTVLLAEGVSLADANEGLMAQMTDMLDEEEEEDAALRGQFGKEYPLPSSKDAFGGYRKQLSQYKEFVGKAKQADSLIAQKIKQWERPILLLGGDVELLANAVPDARRIALTPAAETSAHRVRSLLARWESLQVKRQQALDRIRRFAAEDDPKARLLQEAEHMDGQLDAGQFEPLMEQLLAQYEPFLQPLQQQSSLQASLTQELNVAAADFFTHKEAIASGTQARQAVLQQLTQASDKFDEIRVNLSEGAKFYHDLHAALNRLADEVRERIAARRHAVEQADASIVKSLEAVRLAGDTSAPPDVLMTGVWRPEDGIRLANSAAKPKAVKKPASNLFDPATHSIQFGKR
ncbi:BRO1-like domain-domain-containing protein [Protomyces lactucae-debilis]|uniref:BRO1-like domain-domain-containing protein n=1 Tax=Protomyces lactucae-debilis TaxID=2754530 RepID=A0A1Y2FGL0_PROLT|nr:BRO1-like domain-containing protein [Protomyces lactucae-debilis]ORY83062.1 BRO1-like domain-domain-containing protein [Protomyces lactucae-debilis]